MLFHVRMDVSIPHDLDPQTREKLLADEKARALELQRAGKWPHLWRIVGQYGNIEEDLPLAAAVMERGDELTITLITPPPATAADN